MPSLPAPGTTGHLTLASHQSLEMEARVILQRMKQGHEPSNRHHSTTLSSPEGLRPLGSWHGGGTGDGGRWTAVLGAIASSPLGRGKGLTVRAQVEPIHFILGGRESGKHSPRKTELQRTHLISPMGMDIKSMAPLLRAGRLDSREG